MKAVTVVGIGDDGCVGLSSKAQGAIAGARILAGGERHLDFFPNFDGEKIILKSGISQSIEKIAELAGENSICVLASGDPLYHGIGNLIGKKIGKEHVEFIPAPSSIACAFAKIGIPWDDAKIISLHAKPIQGFIARLQREKKAACFTDPVNTPTAIARYMKGFGETGWTAHVCENLGSAEEKIGRFSIDELCEAGGISDLNVLILLRNDPSWRPPSPIAFLEEEAYARRMPKAGLITKREVRVLSLAALSIRPDAIVWDIGAGSGSVAIEAAKLAYEGEVYAVEVDPEGVEICNQNITAHKTDNVRVIAGRAPEALENLPDPDGIFIGGSKGSMGELIALSMKRISPGGRVAANAVTLDNVGEAYSAFKCLGITPEVMLVNISRGQKLANYLRYESLNPIHIFSAGKPENLP